LVFGGTTRKAVFIMVCRAPFCSSLRNMTQYRKVCNGAISHRGRHFLDAVNVAVRFDAGDTLDVLWKGLERI